ncbi:hypothetical protein OIU79_018661 [Salix purpurea]|uniref:Uncharacterized protein n=1 Tax=Salix purpurea TaxID=77065 RepID=A0A9Q0WZX7_SALPP|nr:hypothetical protein OIU79_018661 [Salix purpurea]
MTISTSSLWQITTDLGFCLLTFMEGSGFSDASSAVRKKRSNTSRQARNESHASSGCIHVSPLPSTPPSETNMMKNEDGGFGEFDETSNDGSFRETQQHHNPCQVTVPFNSSRNFTPSLTAMARAPGKHGLDQALDWELLKDTDKKMKKKSQASDLVVQ